MTHPGIRLRISVPAGVIMEGDSDLLYYSARFGAAEPCRPDCPYGCSDHGWVSLIDVDQGLGLMETWPEVPIRVEVKPVMLTSGEPDEGWEEGGGGGCAGGDRHRGRAGGPVRRWVAGVLARAAAVAAGRGGGMVRDR